MSPPVRTLFALSPLNTPQRQLRSLVCRQEADVACEGTVQRIRQKFHFDVLRMSPLKKQAPPPSLVSEAPVSSEVAAQTEWTWSVLCSKNQYVPEFYHPRSVRSRQSPSSAPLRLVEINQKQSTGLSSPSKKPSRCRSTSLPSYQFRVRKTSFAEKKREISSKGGCLADRKESVCCIEGTGKPGGRFPQQRGELVSRSRAVVDHASKENIPVPAGASRRRRSLLLLQEHPQAIDNYFKRILPYRSS